MLSGARDELKQLARARLEESGWTDEVRQLCRGAPGGHTPPDRAAPWMRLQPQPQAPGPAAAPWGLAMPRTAPPCRSACLLPRQTAAAEYVAREGADSVRHDQIVAAVKPAARQKVPDNLKAELLKR